jgi:methane monooxygenase PmoA-like
MIRLFVVHLSVFVLIYFSAPVVHAQSGSHPAPPKRSLAGSIKQEKVPVKRPIVIEVIPDAIHRTVVITAGGQPFTEFIYPDSLEKPVLYPVVAGDGQLVTRGFPLQPRPGEPVDHPHHIGIWFNYENVNGLDFWNNSFAIPIDKKHLYGWIRTDSILQTESGVSGKLVYSANWTDQSGNILLKEKTSFRFFAGGQERIIDRVTTLTASCDISLPDNKDGLIGMRVTRELQIPASAPKKYIDNKGNITTVAAGPDLVSNGNYLTSAGKMGDSAWATRGNWCMLYGKKGEDTLSIVMIDHPRNPGYPTYWHARGYGLFAANPLGQKVFSNGKESLNLSIKKGQSVTFRYRIVINAGNERMSTGRIGQLTDDFAGLK